MTMKKCYILLAIVLSIVGCTRQYLESVISEDDGQYFSREYEAVFCDETKTIIEKGGKVSWTYGDTIRYYSRRNGTVGESIVSDSGNSALLRLDVANDASFLICVYGGKGLSSNTGSSMTIEGTIPAEQTGRFEDTHIAIAKSYDVNQESLLFRNITSYLKFSLIRSDVAKVVFQSNDGTILHGNGSMNISFADEIPSASFPENGSSSLSVQTRGAGTFYMATLPCNLESGFKMDCFDDEGAYLGSVKTEKRLALGSGTILDLGVLDSRVELIYDDLSKDETANCYLISRPGYYRFNACVKGNSSEPLDGTMLKAEVLWESFGTGDTPNSGDVVSDVYLKNGYIHLKAITNGNALVAVTDRDEDILWSWHIWICEGYDPSVTDQQYANDAGIMMDRNLGAITSLPGDVGALGLLYEWGRKDPFLNAGVTKSDSAPVPHAGSTIDFLPDVVSNAATGTVDYSVKNPTVYICGNEINRDWYYTGNNQTDDTRWSSEKTKYDPCPQGYRVPDGGRDGVWNTAASGLEADMDIYQYETMIEKGTDLKYYYGTERSCWYPATGFIAEHVHDIYEVGTSYSYWSCTPIDGSSSVWTMFSKESGVVGTLGVNVRGAGLAVRCMRENSSAIIPADSVTISSKSLLLEVGETARLSAKVFPENASIAKPYWRSSSPNIISVDQNGVVKALARGGALITAYSWDSRKATCYVTAESFSDLSEKETANSYIVSAHGYYKFEAAKGFQGHVVSDISSVDVLWESFGTDVSPRDGDLIHYVQLKIGRNGKRYISFAATQNKGNALVAARDASGKILWSWHIWMTDRPQNEYLQNYAGTLMDRNLGATSVVPGDVKALGLFYRWGDKNPRLGSSKINDSVVAASTPVKGQSTVKSDGVWSSQKTDDDPCPPGYRVPDGGNKGVWHTACPSSNTPSLLVRPPVDESNHGYDLGEYFIGSGQHSWYPQAGYISPGSNGLTRVGELGYYWTCSAYDSEDAYDMKLFWSGGGFVTDHYDHKTFACSVRCQKM